MRIINTARGGLVDESAMAAALESGEGGLLYGGCAERRTARSTAVRCWMQNERDSDAACRVGAAANASSGC